MHTQKINWKNAIIAGVIGTLVFDLVGLMLTGQWWDIPALLGAKTGLGLVYGITGHFSNGILLAILYAGIAPSLWGPAWARTILFVTAETVALVWLFMFPLLGAGIAGTKMGEMVPLISLLRHLAYGVPLYLIIHKFNGKNSVS